MEQIRVIWVAVIMVGLVLDLWMNDWRGFSLPALVIIIVLSLALAANIAIGG